ncbi:MAG: hypothetical protein ACKVP0_20805 [Pirellulaceae bacterium]
MGLTASQRAIWQKARALGNGGQAVALTDEVCSYLLATIVWDLELQDAFPEFPIAPHPFFTDADLSQLGVTGHDPYKLFERLIEANSDADTYFACLGTLHKARLKYERILSTQPIPTLEQVGPRGLLQYGKLTGEALAGFLFWRKWFFDIDNRAGQETGYLFEPIIAYALGGTPAPAKKSPVKRHADSKKGRQVDCILDLKAYEFKIRVTIAASGQGRWQEELDFPVDCKQSGYIPVLVCMDSTPNPKLDTLVQAFLAQGGEVHVGEDAWRHLDDVAGETMSRFIERYVRLPIQDLLSKSAVQLPDLNARWRESVIEIRIGKELLSIPRSPRAAEAVEEDEMPEDADEGIPGV